MPAALADAEKVMLVAEPKAIETAPVALRVAQRARVDHQSDLLAMPKDRRRARCVGMSAELTLIGETRTWAGNS